MQSKKVPRAERAADRLQVGDDAGTPEPTDPMVLADPNAPEEPGNHPEQPVATGRRGVPDAIIVLNYRVLVSVGLGL